MDEFRVVGEEAVTWVPSGGQYGLGPPLPPGTLINGTLERVKPAPKRVRKYADKMVRPAEDKVTPPRQPDPRLRNPLAGTG